MTKPFSKDDQSIADSSDLLTGAQEMAAWLHKASPTQQQVRQMFNFIAMGYIPTFRIGRTVVARRSVLEAWLKEQERGASRPAPKVAGRPYRQANAC